MDASRIESLSFEDSYARLEQVIQELEAGDLGLEESIALYEEGVKLAEHCGRKLDSAELSVTQLVSGVEGQVDEAPFEEG
jgi:exodeoxyribonuclease VII small subunit